MDSRRATAEALEFRLLPAVFTVTNTNDSGNGSLRQAILSANAAAGSDTIRFSLAGSRVINVGSGGLGALPAVTGTVFIDGSSQPGWAGDPLVTLRGNSAGAGADGLFITAANCTVVGLVIEGFGDDGIELQGTVTDPGGGNTVADCLIGRGPGAVAGNGGDGINVSSSNNRIGPFDAFGGNVLSGNGGNGVRVIGSRLGVGTRNAILGNVIGLNAAGERLQNGAAGVLLASAFNTVGSARAAEGNVISGNAGDGVLVDGSGAGGNEILGNFVGTTPDGTAPRANGGAGVHVRTANNVVGGAAPGARNVISGNATEGVWLQGAGATGNAVLGNYIGLASGGDAVLHNGPASTLYAAVRIDGASGNTVGGTTAAARNVIAGSEARVAILGGAANNSVHGNYIGTDRTGTVRLGGTTGVGGYGVLVTASSGNDVGGVAAGAGNLISGNGVGVYFFDADGNRVRGNLIGLRADGAARLLNVIAGVQIASGADDNLVGGAESGARNVISGNVGPGVLIEAPSGPSATGNRVEGNYIGTDASGAAPVQNERAGILLGQGATSTVVGGAAAGAGNVISGNLGPGVEILFSSGNVVAGNRVGTTPGGDAPRGNNAGGVLVLGIANDNVIGGTAAGAGNVIAFNGDDGVRIDGGGFNAVLRNSIFSNGGPLASELGIDLGPDGVTPNDPLDADFGPNGLLNYPVIDSADTTLASTRARGSLASTPLATFTIDFYSNAAADNSGFGEGRTYIGSVDVTTDAAGTGQFFATGLAPVPAGSFITAVTAERAGSLAGINTSEFSRAVAVTVLPFARVSGVFVSGTAWTPRFRDAVDGVADHGWGYQVGEDDVVPWLNINRITVVFDREVAAKREDLTVRGANVADYEVTAIADAGVVRFFHTWTLGAPVGADRLRIELEGDAGGVNTDGQPIDGDRDGDPGGDFRLRLNVLPGDVNRDRRVDGRDVFETRRRYGSSTSGAPAFGGPPYVIFYDVNGDGRVSVVDLVLLRRRLFTALPPKVPA